MKQKFLIISIFILLFLNGKFLFSYTSSTHYALMNLDNYNLLNSDYKTSYSYTMLGTLVSIGNVNLTGSIYGVLPGVLNLSRGPQDDVSTAYVFPNPCNLRYGCNGVSFTRLTVKCEIKIYTISGEHVVTIYKDSNVDDIGWDLKDKNGRYVASGLYIFYIKDSNGITKRGKIVVIR